jgi:hypothetical protein
VLTLVSRATNLPQLLTIAGFWRFCQPGIVKILPRKAPELTGVYAQSPWDVSSQDSSIISKIASMSASDTGDFLRLARSWLKIVVASGVNFSKSVAAGAEFCFSGREFRLDFFPRGALCFKLLAQFLHFLPKKFFFAFGVT